MTDENTYKFFGKIDNNFKKNVSRLFQKTPYAKYLVVDYVSKDIEPKVSNMSYSSITTIESKVESLSISEVLDSVSTAKSSQNAQDIFTVSSVSTDSTVSSVDASIFKENNKRLLLHLNDISDEFNTIA